VATVVLYNIFHLEVSTSETPDYQLSPTYREYPDMPSPMQELKCLITGIYADDQGRIYVHMREFLLQHGMPDKTGSKGGCVG
jgi:hypothetical protein